MATIGENIKKLREKNGMSQSELAAKIARTKQKAPPAEAESANSCF